MTSIHKMEMPEVKYRVKRWCELFDVTDPGQLTTPIVNGYILKYLLHYRQSRYKGRSMWEYFKDDFKGFTQMIWKLGDRKVTRQLREVLILRDVWVQPVKGFSYGRVLQICLEEKVPHIWTDEIEQERLQLVARLQLQSPAPALLPQASAPRIRLQPSIAAPAPAPTSSIPSSSRNTLQRYKPLVGVASAPLRQYSSSDSWPSSSSESSDQSEHEQSQSYKDSQSESEDFDQEDSSEDNDSDSDSD